jgi:uncharacterized protein YceK
MKKLLMTMCLLSPGCVALKVGPSIYGATVIDIKVILSIFPRWQTIWFLIDLPFSFALETLVLPIAIGNELLKIIY